MDAIRQVQDRGVIELATAVAEDLHSVPVTPGSFRLHCNGSIRLWAVGTAIMARMTKGSDAGAFIVVKDDDTIVEATEGLDDDDLTALITELSSLAQAELAPPIDQLYMSA